MPRTWTIEELDRAIAFALKLGFADDVKHWQKLRADLMAERRNKGES